MKEEREYEGAVFPTKSTKTTKKKVIVYYYYTNRF